jgi:acetyl-CoA synthetase
LETGELETGELETGELETGELERGGGAMSSTDAIREARDLLLAHREDYESARRLFRWPVLEELNWAIDWFDVVARENPSREALRIVSETHGVTSRSFGELSSRSSQVANWLRSLGVERKAPVLLMLGNTVELWEALLGCMKIGAIVIPTTTLLSAAELADRIARGRVKAVVAASALAERVAEAGTPELVVGVGNDLPAGWRSFEESRDFPGSFVPDVPTRAGDPMLWYFTSGTTAKAKLVEHTHYSYPIGHLSTMYWIGLRPGDVHLNISSPGWAKHAWSSVFAPWNAEATVLVLDYARFDASSLLDSLIAQGATTICAPPTVWRMLVKGELGPRPPALTEAVSAGEPLNPEVIEAVRAAWGITVRDGYGQTETTAQVGNSPRQLLIPGSMGRPLPGYDVAILDDEGKETEEGEICVRLDPRPGGLMTGYRDDQGLTAQAMRGGAYHTGDVARVDSNGFITYVGRTDDVFKSSDYRISPFELESVLIEHEAVAEAAVVPSPDPVRLAVPKAFVSLVPGREPEAALAAEILHFARKRLSPFKRIRRIEFAELPKTISGKIRRVELRETEAYHVASGEARRAFEFFEDDFDTGG